MIRIDDDGYIRLRREVLEQIRLIHLVSGLDEEEGQVACGAVHSDIRGYTEWVSASVPAVSVGWDWHLDMLARPVTAVCSETPRSNLMLVDEHGGDAGLDHTARCLKAWVETLEWKSVVLTAIGLR